MGTSRYSELPDAPPSAKSAGTPNGGGAAPGRAKPAAEPPSIEMTGRTGSEANDEALERHASEMSADLQTILTRERSMAAPAPTEDLSVHLNKLMHWMRAQQLAVSNTVNVQVERTQHQATGMLEQLGRRAQLARLEQAEQLQRMREWLQAQSDEAQTTWHRTLERFQYLASREGQSSAALTYLVLRALNDEEPSCEDAMAYLQALTARDPVAVVDMLQQLADSLMYFGERHPGAGPGRAGGAGSDEGGGVSGRRETPALESGLQTPPPEPSHDLAAYPHALEAWLLTECNKSRHFKLRWVWCLQATGGEAAARLLNAVQSLSLYECGLPEQNFIDALLELSRRMCAVPRETRQAMLQRALGVVNEQLGASVWVPVAPPATSHHRVVRVLGDESIVLSTKARVPYLLICEILPVDEAWDSSPGELVSDEHGRGPHRSATPPPPPPPEHAERGGGGSEGGGPEGGGGPGPQQPQHAGDGQFSAQGLGPSLYSGLDFGPSGRAGAGGVAGAASVGAAVGAGLTGLGTGGFSAEHAAGVPLPLGAGAKSLTSLIASQMPAAWWGGASGSGSSAALGGSVLVGAASRQKFSDIVAPVQLGSPGAAARPATAAAGGGGGGGGGFGPGGAGRAPPARQPTPGTPARPAPSASHGGSSAAVSSAPPLSVRRPSLGPGAFLAAASEPDPAQLKEQRAARLRIFGEEWSARERRVAASSPYGNVKGWSLLPVIVKANDDLRQEQFAVQIIRAIQRCYDDEGLPLPLHTCQIVATAPDGGLVQVVTNAISLDSVKKRLNGGSLSQVFTMAYGQRAGRPFQKALALFTESCAAWAVVAYLLQIKDRHNGNILLHADGYIVHIDFGFLISNSPGGNIGFESAPFKLTHEYVELMGGADSATFRRFRTLFVQGYLAARKRDSKIMQLVEMTRTGVGRFLPCFLGGEAAVEAMRQRFQPGKTKREAAQFASALVDSSIGHWRTTIYDQYQRCCTGIQA